MCKSSIIVKAIRCWLSFRRAVTASRAGDWKDCVLFLFLPLSCVSVWLSSPRQSTTNLWLFEGWWDGEGWDETRAKDNLLSVSFIPIVSIKCILLQRNKGNKYWLCQWTVHVVWGDRGGQKIEDTSNVLLLELSWLQCPDGDVPLPGSNSCPAKNNQICFHANYIRWCIWCWARPLETTSKRSN